MKIEIKSNPSYLTEDTYIFYCVKKDYIDFLNISKSLPALNENNRVKFVKYQNEMIDTFRNYNKFNHVFMSSPFACENLWQSNFFVGLESMFKLKQMLKEDSDIILFCNDIVWKNVIENEVKRLGGIIYIKNKTNIISAFYKKFNNFISQICFFKQSLIYMLRVTIPFNARLKKKIENIDIVFFTTWFQETIKTYCDNNLDPFFGTLPYVMKKKGLKIALFCHVENFKHVNANKINSIAYKDVYSYFSILRIFDVVSILFKVVFEKVVVPQKYFYLKECIKKDFFNTKWVQSIHALMIKRVVQKIVLSNPKIRIVHTYEGNCWEKGISMAVKNENGKQELKTIGYQHTGFTDFFQKLRFPQFFCPEKIVTTGDLASNILVERFNHSKESVVSAFSLRYSSLVKPTVNKIKNSFPKTFNNVLVLLQGSPYDNFFLNKVEQFLSDVFVKITIRQHPAVCMNNLKTNKKFLFSNQSCLYEDLMLSDIILHSGTTAVLESAYVGVPSIYIDLEFAFSSNPLFNISNNLFVHQGSNKNGFLHITRKIIDNSYKFSEHLYEFQRYYNSYFSAHTVFAEEKLINIIVN